MTVPFHQTILPVFARCLAVADVQVAKARDFAKAKKLDDAAVLGLRLYPDMLPLSRQWQLVSDFCKNGAARLGGVEPPKFEDVEKTFDEIVARFARTRDFVATVAPATIDARAATEIVVPRGQEKFKMSASTYACHMLLPNLYFHLTTAHDVLRHVGVEIGKRDFVGPFEGATPA
ncbi:MAG: DUF1993 domain-containing protein [Hyphomicrobiales bacterium]|nr:DUF1993 family protein [Hyphomicrobiales bacterium]MDE2016270.1 DUF1993 domain-containing protein [Hyphomicrobiales bacterium]